MASYEAILFCATNIKLSLAEKCQPARPESSNLLGMFLLVCVTVVSRPATQWCFIRALQPRAARLAGCGEGHYCIIICGVVCALWTKGYLIRFHVIPRRSGGIKTGSKMASGRFAVRPGTQPLLTGCDSPATEGAGPGAASVPPSIYLLIYLFIHLSIYSFIYLSIHPPVTWSPRQDFLNALK